MWRSGFGRLVDARAPGIPRPDASARAMAASVVAFVCIAAALLPASALASRRDNIATREYLRASYVYVRAAYAEVRTSVASIEASERGIAAACPGALTYAPRDGAFSEIGEAARDILTNAGLQPLRTLILRLSGEHRSLSWSSRALTKLVRAQAAEERAVAELTAPDLCAGIAAWKESDYATLPQGTSSFLARVSALESSASGGLLEEPREFIILGHLRRYEGHASRALVRRISALEARSGKRLNAAVSSQQAKLAAALGVTAL